MPRLFDITGMRFGKLTAIERISNDRRSVWRFACDCGGERVTMAQTVKCGDVAGCAECGSRARKEKLTKHGGASKAGKRNRLYVCWVSMRARCYTPTIPNYANYGARGIAVCDEWADFAAFSEWANANGYRDDLTIDRVDVEGDYSPGNCRWVTHTEQAQNKRQSRWVEYQGETMNLMQLAKRTGISWHTLRGRLNAGLSVDEAVNHPKRGYLPTRSNYGGVRA